MRVCEMPLSLTSFILAALLSKPIIAGFIPDLLHSLEDLQDVRKRCANPCGYYGQLCCASNQVCYTDSNNQAQCGAGATVAVATTATGNWEYFTTTFVQTDLKTVTQTYSSFISTTTLSCSYSLGETPCGNVCCLSGQFCQTPGTCALVGGGSSGYYSGLYTVTTVVTNTASASAPIRPTSNTLITVTSISGATTTQAFSTPVSTDGSIIIGHSSSGGGGLSGGAIAGIVIGVIAGIILLILFCACCIFKGLIDGLLAIFGLGKSRRTTTEEEVYERRSRRGGRRTWFGTRPARSEAVEEKRRSSGWGTAGWMAAGVGALALWLGLKDRRKNNKTSSGYGSSYFTESSISSEF